MKTKKVYLTLDDGRVYFLPLHVVAHDRATYYAQRDKDTTYQEEYDYAMSEDGKDCAMDWLYSNMNWYEHEPTFVSNPNFVNIKYAQVDDSEVRED